jgi:alkylation response protein AidB-like acyl-CoA dehydrogenase
MQFSFTPEQVHIRDTAMQFLASHPRPGRAEAPAVDDALWHEASRELGWAGVAVPEHLGGAGLGAVELAILMQETGAALAPIPLFSTAGLAIPAILAAGSPAQLAMFVPAIAAGGIATMAFTSVEGMPGLNGVTAELHHTANGFRLSGQAGFVPDAASAEHIVIACRAPRSTGANGVSLVVLPAAYPGLRRIDHTTLDVTRPYSTLQFENVDVPREHVLGEPEDAAAALQYTLDFAAAMLAAEQMGGAARVLATTVEFAKTRNQFGRPIGSFQAVKHKLADMMLLVESARSAAYYAACVAAETPALLGEAASVARAYCSDAFMRCAAEGIQLHGGMGFTWEHSMQLYFKRARASATLLGDAAYHRERVAQAMGLDEVAA